MDHGGGGIESAMRRLPLGLDDPTSIADSGLTGPIDIPDPKPRKQPRDLRSRWRRIRQTVAGTVRGLPRVVGLTWRASPVLTVVIGLVTVVSGLLPTASAYMTKLLMDSVVEGIQVHSQHRPDVVMLTVPLLPGIAMTSFGKIIAVAALQFLLFTLTTVVTSLTNIAQQLLQEKMVLTIRHSVMDHASNLHLAFFEGSHSYDLLRQADQEAPSRPLSMMNSAFGLVKTVITFCTMIAMLIAISPLLAVVALVTPIPAFVSQTRYSARSFAFNFLGSPIRRRMEYLAGLVTTDTYAKEIKHFGLGSYLVDRFRRLGQVYYERQRRLIGTRNAAAAAWSMLTTLTSSGIYLYIALQAVSGRLTLGDLALYTGAAAAVQSSVQGLFLGVSGMYENNLFLDLLYRFLGTRPAIRRPERPRPMPADVRGHVRFEEVSFSYSGSDVKALDRVGFEIRPGETVAVVGRNGAGKSTLIKLLCRLYDPTEGRILLDGVDIREYDPEDYRARISAMFQDFVTYQATASENIGLGDLPRLEDREAIADSAERAGIAERIERLPRGFGSPLGRWFDQGVSLSGGEWQKIALARAFMRRSAILVLDEPTSALDAQAEHDLFTRLRALAAGQTTLYISHRFSTVRQSDRIMFLEDGTLVEDGTHTELMRLKGRYAELFTLQASAYLDDEKAAG